MCKPLINKRIIINPEQYLLKWFYEDGTLYDDGYQKKPISFDSDYNAFDPDGKPLIGKYFDDNDNEIISTHYTHGDVKSACNF